MEMTGWEIENPGEDILFNRLKDIKAFVKAYPLSTLSPDNQVLLIIRKYHPTLSCAPDNPLSPSGDYRMCLAYYSFDRYMFFELPNDLSYNMLSVRYDKDISDFAITISSKEMTRVTNVRELSNKLLNYSLVPKTEEEKKTAFEQLCNEIPVVKKIALITQTEVNSGIIGVLKNADFDDWWVSEPQKIGFLDDQEIPVTLTDYNPNEDKNFMAEADETIGNFLSKTGADRAAATEYVYQNCIDFLDAIGYDEDDQHLWDIKNPEEIWNYTTPKEIYVTREPYEDKQVYLRLTFNCEWEQEHGLQLVFNKDGQLVRVSADDGHILGWQGHGMING